LGRIVLDGVAGALWFLPRKGTRKHKNLNVRIHAAGRFLCIFVPLCGYDSAGGWGALGGPDSGAGGWDIRPPWPDSDLWLGSVF